jgi:N-hydroxyarylamine O-acetyltransferase
VDVVDRYLARLGAGAGAEPPSAEALARLHRAHAERVPYETLWIHLGQRWDVDPAASVRRIATGDRGGYCFHLNGAFGTLLEALGYAVTRHIGGVHGPAGPSGDEMTNHLVLTVAGLPAADHPGGTWYVDVGLGDALHEPLPLRVGTHRQEPFTLVLEPVDRSTGDGGDAPVGDWHLTHDPAGGFAGMSWHAAPAGMDAFADRHAWLSTSPESGFVRVLTVQRRDATGVDILRGLTLKRVGAGAAEATIATPAELADALGDVFGLDLAAAEPDPVARATLWERLHATHLAWEAAGRP